MRGERVPSAEMATWASDTERGTDARKAILCGPEYQARQLKWGSSTEGEGKDG